MTAPEEPTEAVAAGVLGLLMVAGGVVVLIDAATLRDTGAALGPAAAPTLVGILLGTLGGALALRSRRFLRTVGSEHPRRWRRLALLVAVLVAFAFLLPLIGYVVSSALLFSAAASLLGAPHLGRVAAVGWTLAALIFVVFDQLIGLSLPTGPWGF